MISERSKDSRWRYAVIPAEDASSKFDDLFAPEQSAPEFF